VQLRSRFIN